MHGSSNGTGARAARDARRPLVLFALPNLDVGGAERHTLELLHALPRDRLRLGLVVAERRGSLLAEVPADVEVWDLGGVGHAGIGLGAVRLARLLSRVEPDVVVARLWFGVCLVHLATRLSRWRGRVVNVEDAMPADYPRAIRLGPLKQRWVRRAHARSDRVLAVSQGVGDQLRSIGVEASKVTVAPNGIDVARIARRAAEPIKDLPSRYVVQVGSLKPLKGPDRLISALTHLDESISAVFVGDGPLRADLERQAAELGVGERVRFAGLQANPFPFMAGALVLVMPSRIPEADPLSALEALAVGTPVLAPERPHRLLPPEHPMELGFESDDELDFRRQLETAIARSGHPGCSDSVVPPERVADRAAERFAGSVLGSL